MRERVAHDRRPRCAWSRARGRRVRRVDGVRAGRARRRRRDRRRGCSLRAGREGWAFVASAAAMAGTVGSLFVTLFPDVLVSSTDAAYSLTVSGTASGSYALKVMTVAAAIFVPLVLLYQAWTYRVFRARVRPRLRLGPPRARRAPRRRSSSRSTSGCSWPWRSSTRPRAGRSSTSRGGCGCILASPALLLLLLLLVVPLAELSPGRVAQRRHRAARPAGRLRRGRRRRAALRAGRRRREQPQRRRPAGARRRRLAHQHHHVRAAVLAARRRRPAAKRAERDRSDPDFEFPQDATPRPDWARTWATTCTCR